MSRDPRVFEVIQRQTYEKNEDRIRVLNAALNGVSHLLNDHLLIYDLSQAENEIIREEILRYTVRNHLDNITEGQIKDALDEIEAELEGSNEE